MSDSAPTMAMRERVGDRITVTQRGSSGIYYAEFSHKGQHCRRSLKTKNKKAAMERAIRLAGELADNRYDDPPKPKSIEEAIAEYIGAKRLDERSHKTLVKYETELRIFAAVAAEKKIRTLDRITAAFFDDYRTQRRKVLAPYTLYQHAVNIKSFIRWCIDRDLLGKDPLRSCRLNKPPRPPKWAPTLNEVNALLKAAPEPLKEILAVLAFTGMRAGELAHLRPQDVDLVGNWIHIVSRDDHKTKTGQSRRVPIHPRLRPILQALPKRRRPYLFCAPSSPEYPNGDHHINLRKINESAQRIAKSANLKVGRKDDGFVVHSLRHFMETFAQNAAIPQRAIDTWLGHTGDKSMASVYYRLSDEDSQRFMKMIPFEDNPSNGTDNGKENANEV